MEYLEFEEFDDKTYSQHMQELEDEYSGVSRYLKRVKNNIVGDVNTLFGKNYDKLTATDRQFRRKSFYGKMGDLRKHNRTEANSKDVIKEKAERKKYIKDAINDNPTMQRTNQKNSRRNLVSTVGGAALGGGAGYLMTSKWRKELAALKLKENPDERDLDEIKSLKRKIAAATAGGTILGGVTGNLISRKIGDNKVKETEKIIKKYRKGSI